MTTMMGSAGLYKHHGYSEDLPSTDEDVYLMDDKHSYDAPVVCERWTMTQNEVPPKRWQCSKPAEVWVQYVQETGGKRTEENLCPEHHESWEIELEQAGWKITGMVDFAHPWRQA